jgi:hypothetical protein
MFNFHHVILAEDFLEYLAPTNWPQNKRIGFCWKPMDDKETDCHMKDGKEICYFLLP